MVSMELVFVRWFWYAVLDIWQTGDSEKLLDEPNSKSMTYSYIT